MIINEFLEFLKEKKANQSQVSDGKYPTQTVSLGVIGYYTANYQFQEEYIYCLDPIVSNAEFKGELIKAIVPATKKEAIEYYKKYHLKFPKYLKRSDVNFYKLPAENDKIVPELNMKIAHKYAHDQKLESLSYITPQYGLTEQFGDYMTREDFTTIEKVSMIEFMKQNAPEYEMGDE